MSISQAYYLAFKARAKLSSEAARPSHNLRLIVGHANLLDLLMLKLAGGEASSFSQSIRGDIKNQDIHTWAEATEKPEYCCGLGNANLDPSSSSESDSNDREDIEVIAIPLCRVLLRHMDSDTEDIFRGNNGEDHTKLARSLSHSAQPPEFNNDLDSSVYYNHRRLHSRPRSGGLLLQRSHSTNTTLLSLCSGVAYHSPSDAACLL